MEANTKTKREVLLELAADDAGQGFVEAAALYLGLGFHPDTPFNDYLDTDGNPEFTPEESRVLDGAIEIASDEFDVYEVSLNAWKRAGLLKDSDEGDASWSPTQAAHP